jgi:hypothetical protein
LLQPIFVVNCSGIFTQAWKAVKQILDPVVVGKIQLSSGVPTAALLQVMDKSVLLEEYGGDNKTPFPHVETIA